MYQRITDVYPISYGRKAPAGFGGKQDVVQQRFNRVIHLSMWPHDASLAELDEGMVVRIPRWSHWIAFGEVPAELSDDEVRGLLAGYKAVLDAIGRAIGCEGFGRHDYLARVQLCNEQTLDEWLVDYAGRMDMRLEDARNNVMASRRNASSAAGRVAGSTGAKRFRRAEIEDYDLDRYTCDVILHNHGISFESTRAEIERKKEEKRIESQNSLGLTLKDMNDLGLGYRDINAKHTYRIDGSNYEVIVVVTSSSRLVRRTGKFVERLVTSGAPLSSTAR